MSASSVEENLEFLLLDVQIPGSPGHSTSRLDTPHSNRGYGPFRTHVQRLEV